MCQRISPGQWLSTLEALTWESFAKMLTPAALFQKIDLIGLWKGGIPGSGVSVVFLGGGSYPGDSNTRPALKLTL